MSASSFVSVAQRLIQPTRNRTFCLKFQTSRNASASIPTTSRLTCFYNQRIEFREEARSIRFLKLSSGRDHNAHQAHICHKIARRQRQANRITIQTAPLQFKNLRTFLNAARHQWNICRNDDAPEVRSAPQSSSLRQRKHANHSARPHDTLFLSQGRHQNQWKYGPCPNLPQHRVLPRVTRQRTQMTDFASVPTNFGASERPIPERNGAIIIYNALEPSRLTRCHKHRRYRI